MKMPNAKPVGTRGSTDQDRAPPPEDIEQKGDLLIRDLWQNRTDSVHDMRVAKTDAENHTVKISEKCLQEEERGKKWMYLEACLHQCNNFSPFVDSVDRLLGVETTTTTKTISSCLATK